MQFIGKRSLDIYLLHFFFLPYHFKNLDNSMSYNSFPALEFMISSFVTIVIICFSLLLSQFIRSSNLLEHYLLGVKKNEPIKTSVNFSSKQDTININLRRDDNLANKVS